ncbi:MAG: hypothetical protein IKI49_03810 [Oscillospiraceae bacterium]|nr:hypothetical protein [Oscillospiraceae bacterium]
MSFKLTRRDSVEPAPNTEGSADAAEKKPQKSYSVTLYICILFAFVIVLVLLSYFGQRRDNSRALLSLREQHDQVTSQAFDNIEKLQEKNMELLNENNEQKKTIEKLQSQITELEDDAEKAAADSDALKKELKAAEDIFALRSALAAKDAEKAAQFIEKLNGEMENLPQNGKEMLKELKAEYDALINPPEEE